MMKGLLTILLLTLIVSCGDPGVEQSEWIEKENENRLLSIREENGKFWISQFDSNFEIVNPRSKPYVQFYDRKMPIDISKDKSSLFFICSEYVPLNQSIKGQFIGKWKSLDDETRLSIKMDSNIELNWDFIRDSGKPVRYYPKRIADGVHFTVGQDTLSYVIKEGYIVDNNGKRYSREKS